MKVFVDTNVALDFLLEREPFFQNTYLLFEAIAADRISGYVSATSLTDIFYIVRKQTKSVERARQAVSDLLVLMAICPVDRTILEAALSSEERDFEDVVQVTCAVSQHLNAVITRDAEGFSTSPIPVLTVAELLSRLSQLSDGTSE